MDSVPAGSAKPATTVFLSYSRDDRAKAEAIVAVLEARGLTVWWDGLIEGGHAFADKIEQALTSADAVVVLWSENSVHSHWVRDEAASGRDRGRMVPVTVGGVEPPLGFRQIQHVDLSRWHGRRGAPEVDDLCHAIMSVAGVPETVPRKRRAAGGGISRRQAITAGAAGVVVIGGGFAGVKLLRGGGVTGTSIGVLPFQNLSGDPAEQYFSDGIAEELRATLSQDSDLAVAAETSSDVADKKSSDPRAVASALRVNYLLEGSVRREADMVRIAAHVVDGATGYDKWSQTFDHKLDDILALQSQIAAFVTDALMSGITASQAPKDRLGGTHNSDAFDAYLRGMALYKQAAGQASDFAALHQFQRAVALDPNYAVAQAALSRAYTVIADSYATAAQAKGYHRQAIDAARAAIRIAPKFADGYSALGFVLLNGELQPQAAATQYQHSFELGYGNADILTSYASFASRTGRFADGRAAIVRAQRLDPLNATVFRTAGLLELDARQYDAAVAALDTALSMSPKSNAIHLALGDVALMRGDASTARAQYEQEPDEMTRLRGLAIADMKLSNSAAAESDFATLQRKYPDSSYYQQAQVLAQWGRTDDALTSLEKAVATQDAGVVRSKNDPLLDPIRKSVRFADVERSLGYA